MGETPLFISFSTFFQQSLKTIKKIKRGGVKMKIHSRHKHTHSLFPFSLSLCSLFSWTAQLTHSQNKGCAVLSKQNVSCSSPVAVNRTHIHNTPYVFHAPPSFLPLVYILSLFFFSLYFATLSFHHHNQGRMEISGRTTTTLVRHPWNNECRFVRLGVVAFFSSLDGGSSSSSTLSLQLFRRAGSKGQKHKHKNKSQGIIPQAAGFYFCRKREE